MSMRLQIDEESSAASSRAGRFEGENFGVLHARVGIDSSPCYVAVHICNDRADVGVRRCQANAFSRQIKGALEKLFVCGVSGHAGKI